ncbi:hypothetical protein VXP97_01025, partial [Acinetobacter sp. 207]
MRVRVSPSPPYIKEQGNDLAFLLPVILALNHCISLTRLRCILRFKVQYKKKPINRLWARSSLSVDEIRFEFLF